MRAQAKKKFNLVKGYFWYKRFIKQAKRERS
uniref:Uncharacterized protein n=1 Tax=Rhizophora mucronata TaxID=61149 RepID=A0A2P2PBW4_RHIMU